MEDKNIKFTIGIRIIKVNKNKDSIYNFYCMLVVINNLIIFENFFINKNYGFRKIQEILYRYNISIDLDTKFKVLRYRDEIISDSKDDNEMIYMSIDDMLSLKNINIINLKKEVL